MKKICYVVTEIYAIKRLMQNFDLKVDKWTDRRTNEKIYKRQNGQRD